MSITPPTRADIYDALDALSRARGQLEAALRVRDPAPEVLEAHWRRAAGAVRVLHHSYAERLRFERRRGGEGEG